MKVATVCIQTGSGAVYPAITASSHMEVRPMSDAMSPGIEAGPLELNSMSSASHGDARQWRQAQFAVHSKAPASTAVARSALPGAVLANGGALFDVPGSLDPAAYA
jgi:hypothetical protein